MPTENRLVLSWDSEEEVLRSLKILSIFHRLLNMYYPATLLHWLHGYNAFLNNQRPIDLLRQGKFDEVLNAIQQDEAGSYA